MTKMTLCDLSDTLVELGYPDIFDGQVDGECLDIPSMTGSWAFNNGDKIIYFDIITLDEESKHLNTIIEIDENDLEQ